MSRTTRPAGICFAAIVIMSASACLDGGPSGPNASDGGTAAADAGDAGGHDDAALDGDRDLAEAGPDLNETGSDTSDIGRDRDAGDAGAQTDARDGGNDADSGDSRGEADASDIGGEADAAGADLESDAQPDADLSGPPILSPDALSPAGRAAYDVLSTIHAAERGNSWDFFGDAQLGDNWILQSPPFAHWGEPVADLELGSTCDEGPDCDLDFGLIVCGSDADCAGTCTAVAATVTADGDAPERLCVGHSDSLYDAMYEAIVSAESFVDITSLSPPDGRFEAAIRNAITRLSRREQPVEVRVLFGNIIAMEVDTEEVLESLTRDADPDGATRVTVGGWRKGLDSWNHAKIVAVDGRLLIQGGHNLWTDHYLTHAPIHDLSMRVGGEVASAAHRFANAMWTYTCEDHTFTGWTSRDAFPAMDDACPTFWAQAASEPRLLEASPVLALGRLGALGENVADDAIVAMLAAATTSIHIIQQDIGPIQVGPIAIGDWPEPILAEMARALVRGVDVYTVLSNPGSIPGGLPSLSANYGNGWTAEDIVEVLLMWFDEHPDEVPEGTSLTEIVCERFHVALMDLSPDDDTWPDGTPFGNHSKFFMVDELAFYIGSQNFYPADLAELGLVVDDALAAAELLEAYIGPIWAQSRAGAVSGSDAPQCVLQ